MLASLKCLDRDLGMPVVRRHNADNFNLFVVKHLAVIFDGFGFAFADPLVVPSPFPVIRIDIADGDDVPEPIVVVRVPGPHATEPDATDLEPIRGRYRCRLATGCPIRRRGECRRGCRSLLEKRPS